MTKSSRKIGLGVMGWADLLLQLKIPYNSDDAIYLAEKVMKFINDTGVDESVKLGEEKGNFPAFKGSYWSEQGYKYMRNSTITTIAPTGTIGIIADTSGGVEPQFSLAYTRVSLDNQELIYTNKYLEKELKKRGLFTEDIMVKISKTGSVVDVEELPEDIKKVFVTSREISPEWHIKMQAAFQKYTHNAVSKTINMPFEATIDDVKQAYFLAYKLGCKGITIYRDGSRQIQVLTSGTSSKKVVEEPKPIQKLITKELPKDECPICHSKMHAQEGCYTCTKCSYSKCS
jgi:ribonucleoside-diphosphate reductase alpha chain